MFITLGNVSNYFGFLNWLSTNLLEIYQGVTKMEVLGLQSKRKYSENARMVVDWV